MWRFILFVFILLFLSSCGNNFPFYNNTNSFDQNPHTGDEEYEEIFSEATYFRGAFYDLRGKYFVSTGRLRVRSAPKINFDNILGVLVQNDEVEIIDKNPQKDDFVEIIIIRSDQKINESDRYFVSYKYLSSEKTPLIDFYGKNIFVIKNIAAEKLRVYERICIDNSCPHKMIMEASIVAGEDKKETRTALGSFRITSWHKFYEDGAGRYPSWYYKDYSMPPPPGAKPQDWTSKRYLPGRGSVRGAFGWYTAHVGPNAYYQWLHGTIGWGADKRKFIWATRTFLANLLTDPRSHGCSRTDNETIAYIRQIVPVGTPVVKVYAIEDYEDQSRARYIKKKGSWDYILTKTGSRKDGQKSDKQEVLNSLTRGEDILEEGTYTIDKYPNAVPFGSNSGNLYNIPESEMRGVFNVDTGKLINYSHPKGLVVGGYRDELVPSYMIGK